MIGRAKAVVLILAGAVLWGTTGSAQALGPSSASPFGVGVTRLVLGGGLLVVLALIRPTARPAGTLLAGARTAPIAAAVGAAGVVAYQLSFFAAVDRAGVAVGTTVAIGSSPLFTGLIDWLLGGQMPSRRWWAATGVGVAGLVGLAGAGSPDLMAVLLALTAGASYAAYAIASKCLLDTGLSPLQAMAVVFGGGAVLILPGLAVADLSFLRAPSGLVMLVWLAVGTVVVAYILFAAGLTALPAPTVASLSLMEPLTAALLGVLVLGEQLAPLQFGGAALLLGALMLLARGVAAEPPRAGAPADVTGQLT